MKELIIDIIAIFGYGSLGAWCISGAVRSFKEHRYFMFGLGVMIAIAEAAFMFKALVLR